MDRKIFKDFWAKFVAVLFAIMLWYFVTNEKVRQVSINVSLNSSVPDKIQVVPDRFKVTLRGKFSQILRLNPRTIRIAGIPYARLLKEDTTAETVCEIRPDSVFVPSEFQVVKVEPSTIKLIKRK